MRGGCVHSYLETSALLSAIRPHREWMKGSGMKYLASADTGPIPVARRAQQQKQDALVGWYISCCPLRTCCCSPTKYISANSPLVLPPTHHYRRLDQHS
ncbi:uncharacterized protein LAJ45_09333 [Morchella importuna]|uniref:uncharacterized protein n=1 Tax=Morchella importuna TaxID=1174673 RepID=UPI001E8E921B|nr:uncharacterized protein LAJ45_09333 [Morchella importuna]KAH8146650.1 hypothetical protein LAJ45_09333 [Morchella importuna]